MAKLKFNIGDYVRVLAVSNFDYDEDLNRKLVTTPSNFEGWIIGCSRRYEGRYISRTPSVLDPWNGDYSGGEPAYLERGRSHRIWKVVTFLTAKPIEALEDNIEIIELALMTPQAPLIRLDLSDQYRKLLSEESKKQPRDSKGRFVNNGPIKASK